MHPAFWLDEVFSNRCKVRILRYLAMDPSKVRTENEIARGIHMSPNSVNRAVRELRERGIVRVERVGSAHAVRLRDGPMTSRFQSVFAQEQRMWTETLDLIRAACPPGVSCVLFGSTARAEAQEGSDVDLLLVANDQDQAADAMDRIYSAVHAVLPVPLECIILDKEGLRERWDGKLLHEIRKEGERLAGPPLEAFL